MTTIKFQDGIDILRLPVCEEEYIHQPWYIKYTQSHILHSKCSKSGLEVNNCTDNNNPCQFCIYSQTLEMPHMPDMVFPNNVLYLKHKDGALLEFHALDALKRVSNGKINIQLACAEAWRESRLESKEYMKEAIKPFDWTFTTDYMGTISGFQVEDTDEHINVEKLKRKDKILFYVDLTLFEDELHDNGIASLSVKMRVMPETYFILLRYFLRIDKVMLRVNDTRIYHEFGKDYVLREYTSREAKVDEIDVSPSLFVQPNEIAPHLPIVCRYNHKLIINQKSEHSTFNISISDSININDSTIISLTAKDNNSTTPESIEKK